MQTSSPTPDDFQLRRSPELLDRQRSCLVVIDVQQKLLPVISHAPDLLETMTFLLNAAQVLNVPVCISEQYPQGLGETVPEVAALATGATVFQKLHFSAAEGLTTFLSDHAGPAAGVVSQIVLVGIETHVCVLQTAMDLLSHGRSVFVVQDAVGSRHPADHETALRRLRDAGGVVCSAESVVFEWCSVAGTDKFRQISRLVRSRDEQRRPSAIQSDQDLSSGQNSVEPSFRVK